MNQILKFSYLELIFFAKKVYTISLIKSNVFFYSTEMTISCFLLLVLAIVLEMIKSLRSSIQDCSSSNCKASAGLGEQKSDRGTFSF